MCFLISFMCLDLVLEFSSHSCFRFFYLLFSWVSWFISWWRKWFWQWLFKCRVCVSELPQRPSDAVRRPSSPCICLAGTCWRQEHQSARCALCPAGVLGEEGGGNCVDCLHGPWVCGVCEWGFIPLCMCGVYASVYVCVWCLCLCVCVCGVLASVFVVFMPVCVVFMPVCVVF